MATKIRRRKNLRKHLSSFAIAGVVLLMLVFVFFASLTLRVSNGKKQERIDELSEQIAAEEERAAEIEEYGKYVQTKKYAEERAKKDLNLVFPDEILFKGVE